MDCTHKSLPLTLTCVFATKISSTVPEYLQFSTIPCNCPCGLALTSLIPCAGVCPHIPLWVGKGLPAHSHIVCPTVTYIPIHVLCVMVDVNTTSMACSIHFSCHQQFKWVDPKAKNDMFIEYLTGIRLSPPTIILAKDMFGVCHVIRQLWDYNFHATYYHEGHTQDQLAKARNSFFSQRTPILVLSLQTDAFKQFVNSAQYVLVLDFPDSIDRSHDWKILVNLKDKYGLITSFISDPDLHLLSDLWLYLIMKDEPTPIWLTNKLGHIPNSAVFIPDSHVHQVPFLPSSNVIGHTYQARVWPQPNTLPLSFSPPESVYQPNLQIDYGDPGRSYPQVDFPPAFSPQSSNCSDNGDHVPSQSQDEYLDIQADAWVLAENISNYDYDDNHSQPSLDDENTHCYDSDYQHGYPPDPPNLKDHSDLDSSWNSDQDSWFTMDNSQWPPPVSQENPPTEASPPETMVDEQSLASPMTESQVVMAGELARLQQELHSVQNTLADEHDHFALASKDYEQAIQHLLASNNRLCHSITQLQAVMRPSCSPTQSPSDVSLAQAKDVNGSHVNPDSFPYPSVDCIQECLDTPVPNGIQQRLALPRPKPRPRLSLKKDVSS